MDTNYDPQKIEAKWQKRWEEQKLFDADFAPGRKKYYVLEMLPYPSGDIHMGHVRNYSIGDALARYMSMKGLNVLHPIGWDSFGLPAENAAIKNQRPPAEFTFAYFDRMRRQLKRLGVSYDWRRELATCDPEYYRWNQWFFLKMLERGLAYRKKSRVNWCPACGTVLANEQVVNGCCWRHEETPVVERELVVVADESARPLRKPSPAWLRVRMPSGARQVRVPNRSQDHRRSSAFCAVRKPEHPKQPPPARCQRPDQKTRSGAGRSALLRHPEILQFTIQLS